ncbi:MAG TPA: phosphopentomutase [Candidatus Limnocylindria bacterium]|nr:phosphopentomutase [Candidatus Limnocylindria bacterium]
MREFERIFWIVLDSVGIGELPDAEDYGDVGRNTLGHIAESRPLEIPNLVRLGLVNIAPLKHQTPAAAPIGAYGKGATRSPGKDTTTGHWEMAGVWLDQAFPVYKNGFPWELIEDFEKQIGRKTIGNKPASGTEIIKELGQEHVRTGKPIVYTSGDSVFQIAAHEEVIPVAELYHMCEVARKLLDGPHRVGRVIARPFTGMPGHYVRTTRRHDYAVDPPEPMLLDVLAERKVRVFGIGKIHDIYNGRGVEEYVTTKGNADGMEKLTVAISERKSGLIFCNLVDFDMLYGHRKDVEGFARSLEEFDRLLAEFLPLLSLSDLLMITADHGCDPDPRWATTDHSREYVPILAYSSAGGAGVNLGVRDTLADMGQTIAENFGGTIPHGKSFLNEMRKQRRTEAAR